MSFHPDYPPSGDKAAPVAGWAMRQFQRIAQQWGAAVPYVQLQVLHAAPTRTEAGMLIYADGADYDPGSGAGLYRRSVDNTSWTFIG